jgi:beta-galactosidase
MAAFVAMPVLASVVQARSATDSIGLEDGWEFYKGPLDARFQVWHSGELVTWEKATVPHCFNAYDACDPDVPAYRGQGWYRRKIKVANPYANGRTLLHFEGAAQRAEVYTGTTLVASHSGGYDEFVVDVTEACRALKSGEAMQLAVLCDNARDIERMPSDLSDFTLYGGLYRHVRLVYVPAVSLEAVHTRVEFEPGKAAKVAVTARLYAPVAKAAKLRVEIVVEAPRGEEVFRKTLEREAWEGEAELATFEIAKPELWSPKTPKLYRCTVAVIADGERAEVSHKFGVRHAKFEEHGPFMLNGERLLIRGTHRHHDHAGYAAAMPDELIRREMEMIKELGANFIRLAHYQQSRLVLELCDELGLMVWEETPWCRSGVQSELFKQRGRAQLTAMIDQHRNHPSVILWGLGNEDDWPGEPNEADHAAIRGYFTELRELARKLDPTRQTSLRRCDFARDIPDVYSPSIWAGWYSGHYTEYKAALEKARQTVPHMLHAEWGADSHEGRHAEDPEPALSRVAKGEDTAEKGFDYKLNGGAVRVSRDGEWSETYACELLDWYLKTQEELPWLTGAVQWIFKDFTTPLRVENPVPRVNQKGLVTRDMQKKEAFFVVQSYWSEKPMLRIYGHNWPVRWGAPEQKRTVRVYSNAKQVELFLNGQSVGVKKRDPQDFPAAGLRWELAFRPGKNTLRAVAPDGLSDEVDFVYQDKPWGKPERLRLEAKKRDADRATIEAVLEDAAGLRCLDSRAAVRFELAGDGRLKDNLGTPTGSRVVQLYNGRAEISLTQQGTVIAGVTSQGVKAAFVTLLQPGESPVAGAS